MDRISNYSNQIRGVSYKPEDVVDVLDDTSIILLRANNIRDGQINYDDVIYIKKNKVSEKQILKKGDILICASSGSKDLVGKAAQVKDNINCTFGAFCKVVRPNNIHCGFLGMYFQSKGYRRVISQASAGANINNIRNEDIDCLELNVPSTNKQEEIYDVLSKLDNVIVERNKELVELDNLIKSRFVEMFGDYHINDKGFESHKGSELFKFSSGKFLPEENRLDKGIPVYGGNGIAWYTDSSLVDYPTVIIGRVGAWCGNVHMVTVPVWITDNAIYIKEQKTNKFTLEFLTELMKVMDFHQYADFSGQPKITQKPLETLEYLTPPVEMQNEFTDFVHQVDKLKFEVQKSLKETQTLMDSLMQQYFG